MFLNTDNGVITMKIGILGHFARNTDLCDGQTVKTRNVEQALLSGTEEIITVDSYKWKKHPFSFLFSIMGLVIKSDVIIMLPDAGGIKIYPYIINLFSNKKKVKIYSVVGAWLPSYLKKNKRISNQLKKFNYILVETQTMQNRLKEQGFHNTVIVPNFKDISTRKEEEIQYNFEYPLPFCIFSRVMKEKGVSDAVYACDRINREAGRNVCVLDVYGPIYEQYEGEFSRLCEQYSSFVKYKGVVNPSQSVEVLKNYYMLLFPTLFFTEGVPGTIIDAFSAGVPVIASQWESWRDVLTEKDSITYKFADKEELYKKLKFCVENIDTINGYRKDCLRSSEKFSLDMAVKTIWSLIYGESRKNESNSSPS